MKLAFVCTEKLPSPAIRGGAIQIMIDGISPYLSSNNDLSIFSITDPQLPDHEIRDNVHYLRFPRKNYSDLVKSELARHEFDLVHVFNRPVYLSQYKAASPKSHFVLSLHNEMFSPNKISSQMGHAAIGSVDKIMTVSRYISETVVSRFPEAESKLEIVYSGIDLGLFHPSWTIEGKKIRDTLRHKCHLEDKKVILFVGRLNPAKGPHLLIKAMKQIIEDYPNAVLVIAGGKWFSDNGMNQYVHYLRKLAKPLGNHVFFMGYVPSQHIPDLFAMADLFVCSSQWQEPLARVQYEAMAAGIPIITTNRGGNSEVVTHKQNGLVLNNYQSSGAFADAIDFLFSNGYAAKMMAHNGRKQAASLHQFSQVAKRLESVYLRACQTHEESSTNFQAENLF
ncbi:glycosyltransferase family 1 protein [Sporolactobacillus shoreae]|uniref:Glycosyltransferase family 1 protein n=1 Tax=Sporolactobacillus shoreae TaxID=1465501 RepID=A0A4Z0GPV5_9BACL|nr:glycosyltransferase family 4 protein [Sporolactobacillus shoreae]TGA98091.1 glycosyltransferase family 1 protein [Sporolactobacillus shoreae]